PMKRIARNNLKVLLLRDLFCMSIGTIAMMKIQKFSGAVAHQDNLARSAPPHTHPILLSVLSGRRPFRAGFDPPRKRSAVRQSYQLGSAALLSAPANRRQR